jgi:hypothetical protein
MTERPIIFSAEMVRAILAGRKTQTRRVMKLTSLGHIKAPIMYGRHKPDNPRALAACPYGAPGDTLWVREAVAHGEGLKYHVAYKADSQCGAWGWDGDGNPLFSSHGHVLEGDAGRAVGNYGMHRYGKRWTPSIHMPRWASRITLRITDVRVERLQDIEGQHPSESDAIAEGVRAIHHGDGDYYYSAFRDVPHPKNWSDPADAFREVWNSINGAGAWEANPWVWVIAFQRVKP